ncbi:MAG: DUF3187 family protein [Woeseiaceae bacterium]
MVAKTPLSRIGRTRHVLFAFGLLAWSLIASAQQVTSHGVPLRNQNPFLQIFGLPPFQSAKLAAPGALDYYVSFDIVSHAESAASPLEEIEIDGESYFLSLSLRRGWNDRFEIGVDLPLVAHAGGFLDNAIKNWHDLLGLSNSKRRGPNDQLAIRYSRAGETWYELNSTSFDLGDIQLSAAVPLRKGSDDNPFNMSLRGSIKLPTGSAEDLSGSGATDVSLGIYASSSHTLWQRELDVSGFAGALLLGDGDVLTDIQRSVVPYGGIAASWWATERFGISVQLQAEGAYFDTELDVLGGTSAQLAVGFDYRMRNQGTSLHLAITEDIGTDRTTTPDFGVHFSVRRFGAQPENR